LPHAQQDRPRNQTQAIEIKCKPDQIAHPVSRIDAARSPAAIARAQQRVRIIKAEPDRVADLLTPPTRHFGESQHLQPRRHADRAGTSPIRPAIAFSSSVYDVDSVNLVAVWRRQAIAGRISDSEAIIDPSARV
jgi:hypothetical protein